MYMKGYKPLEAVTTVCTFFQCKWAGLLDAAILVI